MQNNMKNGQTFPSELLNCLNKLYVQTLQQNKISIITCIRLAQANVSDEYMLVGR